MKIQNINRSAPGSQAIHGKEGHGNEKDLSVIFRRTLSDLSGEHREQHLSSLVERIDEQSAKLAKKADLKEFELYRKLIREFIDDVVSNGYAFSKEDAYGARGRHRVFATVKTIDSKLDALAKEVLSGQADNIAVLHQIDDIRGLLLDILA